MVTERPSYFHKWSHHAFMLLAVTHFAALMWGDFSKMEGGGELAQLMYVVTGFMGLGLALLIGGALLFLSAETREAESGPKIGMIGIIMFLMGVSWFEAFKILDITHAMVGVSWAVMAAMYLSQRRVWRRWVLENPEVS